MSRPPAEPSSELPPTDPSSSKPLASEPSSELSPTDPPSSKPLASEPSSELSPTDPSSSEPSASDPSSEPSPFKTPPSEPSLPASPPPTPGLWGTAIEKASDETKKWIKSQELGSHDSEQHQARDQISEIIKLIEQKQSECRDKPLKITIGSQTIILREYVADVVTFLTTAGDAAMNFAPPQASAPWAVAKAVMKIPVMHAEQMAALVGTVASFVHIVRKCQLYEFLYTAQTTEEAAVLNLRDVLVDLYVAALELLAKSDILSDRGLAGQTLNAILRPKEAITLVSDLFKKEKKLSLEVQACEATRSVRCSNQQDERLADLKRQLNHLSSPLTRIDNRVSELLEIVGKVERERLLDFISPEKFGKSRIAVRESRTPNTGDWLLAHEGFRTWKDEPSSSTLWLRGTVGTGKTYLTSKVIDHVEGLISSKHEGFAFFYCVRTGPSLQDPLTVLRSFVRQLSSTAHHSNKIQSIIIQQCDKAKSEGRDLGYGDCKDLILASFNLYSKTTVILDALDESDWGSHNLAETLIDMMDKSTKAVKVFISSRPNHGCTEIFEARPAITIDAKNNQQNDIEKFLKRELYSTDWFKNRQQDTQSMIKKTFRKRSDGMFRWVYLQKNALLRCRLDDAIMNWAKKLPKDLAEAYDQLLKNIETERDINDVALAERAIKWVMCSFEDLKVDDLLEAIRYVPTGTIVVRKEKQTQQGILSLCQDLLTIDDHGNVVFPHASVSEYFEAKGWTLGGCDLLVSRVLLGLVMDPQNSDEEKVSSSDFYRYAVRFWPEHVGRHDEYLSRGEASADSELSAVLKSFLGSPEESSLRYREWVDLIDHYDVRWLRPSGIALFSMCFYGFYYTLRDWWEGGKVSEDTALQRCQYSKYSCLAIAASAGCLPICKRLAALIDVNHPSAKGHGIALWAAIVNEHNEIAEFLVTEAKADVNLVVDGLYVTAAEWAATCNADMLQWLVEGGRVQVNNTALPSEYGSVLVAAAARGKVRCLDILVKTGADVNAVVQTGRFGSALAAAAYSRQTGAVRCLLQHGADPTLPLKSRIFASKLAIYGPFEIARFLLDAGADPALVLGSEEFGSVIAAASFKEKIDALRIMVDNVGRGCAMETLRQSRYPENLLQIVDSLRDDKSIRIPSFLEEMGVDTETLRNISQSLFGADLLRLEFITK